MTIDSDDMISLPSPPPPRPAARRDAIDAAVRKFDGVEDAPAIAARKRPSLVAWANMNRRPAGAMMTAALIAVICIPAFQIVLRDHPPGDVQEAVEPDLARPAQDRSVSETRPAPANEPGVAAPAASPEQATASPPFGSPSIVAEERRELESAASDRKAALEVPAPVVAAPAPPPPPPPPSEPEAGGDQNVVVTGSRIPASNMAKQSLADEVGYAARSASSPAVIDTNAAFLSRLQAALKSNDRRAIIALIGLPLRVNFDGRIQTYRSSKDVERDFDRIFTPVVRSAVLNQRPDNLMARDGGRLKGNGRLWFGCGKTSCPPSAPIRIREVNP
jgi:hypothetical protein